MIAPIIVISAFSAAFVIIRTTNKIKSKNNFRNLAEGSVARTLRHALKVNRIALELRKRKSRNPVVISKKTPSHQVPKAGDLKYTDDKIDAGDLDEIIQIDVENKICTAEPGVTFVDLVSATMRYGLTPVVVPEFKTITVGGAVAGCSIESTSFMYGGFHDSCIEYEIVTATGDILTATPDNKNRLLFQMIHGSFGTLGVLTKLKFRLMPARPYVRLTYEKYGTLGDFKSAIRAHFNRRDVDFMDGIIHSNHEFVLSVGNFVDHAPYVNSYDWIKVYYVSTRQREEDYLRTQDYYFRYDRGVTNVHPKSLIGRFFFGKFIGSSEVLKIAEKFHWLLNAENPSINLDVFIPFSRFTEFMDWYSKEFRFFPLWCVPYRLVRNYEWISDRLIKNIDDELFLDLAIYGMEQNDGRNYHKIMEDKLLEIGGLKTLISHNYFSEEDFWKIWNRDNYTKVKMMTDPNNIFRDLYTKTCRASRGIRN